MAQTVKTQGIVLAIWPWSRTSHVVSWLTPDDGVISTLVKGAVRPKSAFLGQYDFFYRCEIVHYLRAGGELRPLREATVLDSRDGLRGRWRETALALYACDLVRELAPVGDEAGEWFDFLDGYLGRLAAGAGRTDAMFMHLEARTLALSGLFPDFSELAADGDGNCEFAVDRGRAGRGSRTVRISPRAARLAAAARLAPPTIGSDGDDTVREVLRFLGIFIAWHIDLKPERRHLALETALSRRLDRTT